jgi:pullulanase
VPLERIDYAGQPAGYVSEPGEVVNYVENHDNQTLFDANVFKLPAGTSREDRARVQHLANAINAFSQGIAYFHAGQELLRSKSMDRNSYDSGDWFNRIDWSAQDNHFGSGLPPQRDNGTSWPLMQPLLVDASIKPAPADIAWTRDAFFDLLRIRGSTTLLRLRSAADIRARLRFTNTGPQQVPTVLAAHMDGRGLDGAGFAELAYFINVDTVAQRIVDPALRDKAFELHPVQAAAGAADTRAKAAAYDRTSGTFTVPPRTAVVFVVR